MRLGGAGGFKNMDMRMQAKIDMATTTQGDRQGEDRSALVLMLTYVEAECRRLGADAAARHAAMAAALVPELGQGCRSGLAVH
jgi:hypothetical protein